MVVMIEENNHTRLKVTDSDHDSLMTHGLEPDGSIVLTCHDADEEAYASVRLEPREIQALIWWLQGHGSTCQACAAHPGWAHDDERRRREPADVCKTCLGAGVII